MNFLQILLILKARYKVILITFFVTVLTAIVVTVLLPKNYSSTTSLLLNYKGMDPVTGVALPAQLMPGYMATQTDIIKSINIALKVVKQLGLTNSPKVQQQFEEATGGNGDINNWLAGLLLRKLDVAPSKQSSLIDITFTSIDPQFSTLVANSFAENYIKTSVELKADPAQKATGYFSEQIKSLRADLEAAQSRLSKYQQVNGITNPEQNFDVESMRLNELSTQLSIAQASAIDTQSRKNMAQRNSLYSPDIAVSPIIQSLKVDTSRAETKLAEISQRLGENHPQYQSAASELNKIKNQLQEETQRVSNNVSGSANIGQVRESELRNQVAIQKKKVLELNMLRDEMAVLEKDVETAKRAFDTVTQRYSQTNMEGGSNQSDIAILNPATLPGSPSSPKILINIALAVIMGGILGVGFGFLAELADRRVRCREDIASILNVPVFSIVEVNAKSKLSTSLLINRKATINRLA